MRHSRKGVLALSVCLVALGVTALPASAQAANAYWYYEGGKVGGSSSVEGTSAWVMKGSLNGTSISVYCNTSYGGSVSNNPTAGAGSLTWFGFGEWCAVENIENCFVAVEAKSLPWSQQASYDPGEEALLVTIGGIEVELRFFGGIGIPNCPLAGTKAIAKGSVTGRWENGEPSALSLEEAPGISIYLGGTLIGAANVTDSFAVEGKEGGVIGLSDS